MSLPPALAAAARGELPSWARAGEDRRDHMARVAELMTEWARALGLSSAEVDRWRAAAFLHDVLRDAPVDELRREAPANLRELDGPLLHGPVAARRLSELEGVDDGEWLNAVAFHTLGHPELDTLGRALFVADFLDPGRASDDAWSGALRSRMPAERDRVARDVLRVRIGRTLDRGRCLRDETVSFWNVLVEEVKRGS